MPPQDEAIQATLGGAIEDGVFVAVRLGEPSAVLAACRAAIDGGLRVIEVTLTTPGALEVLRELATRGDCCPGAGTVLTVDDVRRVADAGGRFAMSPVLDPDVVDEAHRLGLLAVPGAGTATEIWEAHQAGARLIKVFPAGPLGGPEFLRRLRGPFPDLPLVPTSGPSLETLGEWVRAGAVAVGVGSEVLGDGRNVTHIRQAAAEMRAAMDEARASL